MPEKRRGTNLSWISWIGIFPVDASPKGTVIDLS